MFREHRFAKVVLSVLGVAIAGCVGAAAVHDNSVPLIHTSRSIPTDKVATSRGENDSAKPKDHTGTTYDILHPQSFGYLGGKLDGYAYFYSDTAFGRSVVKAHPRSGTEADVTVAMTSTGMQDPCNPSPIGLELYTVTQNGTNLCEGQPYAYSVEDQCSIDPDFQALSGKAFRVAGAFVDGQYRTEVNGKEVFSLSCMSGAVAKCAHWGYVPGSEAGALTDHFAACVHAARAEYQAGTAYTCPGTIVDFFDTIGIQPPSLQPGLVVEAAWGKNGLLCLNSARFPACQGLVTASACTPEQLSGNDPAVLLVTRSSADNTITSGVCPVDGVGCR